MRRCRIECDGVVLAKNAWVAAGPWERMRGMIGRRFGSDPDAMVLEPCSSIHTVGMAYPIASIFFAGDGTVLRVVARLEPFRAAACRGARGVVELPAGAAAGLPAVGARLLFIAHEERSA